MTSKPSAPAAERNAEPILEVLLIELRDARSVLEIGSGTGQHAVTFARALGHLDWQTSDLAENHDGIRAWIGDAGLPNVHEPLTLDVRSSGSLPNTYDAVFSANTAHIMSYAAVVNMFALVSRVLAPGGVFCLYGPFQEEGRFSTPSNERFHQSLQLGDPDMGIRDLEDLDALAAEGGMVRLRRYAMPANNLLVVWNKHGHSHDDS